MISSSSLAAFTNIPPGVPPPARPLPVRDTREVGRTGASAPSDSAPAPGQNPSAQAPPPGTRLPRGSLLDLSV